MHNQQKRVVIAGWPRTGKTTASRLRYSDRGIPVHHLDDLIEQFGWSELSERASHLFDKPAPWCVEGTAAMRALRKWLARNRSNGLQPCDYVYYLTSPVTELSGGQRSMGKGVDSVYLEIRSELRNRGVFTMDVTALGTWPTPRGMP
jgi:hypothetical protein